MTPNSLIGSSLTLWTALSQSDQLRCVANLESEDVTPTAQQILDNRDYNGNAFPGSSNAVRL